MFNKVQGIDVLNRLYMYCLEAFGAFLDLERNLLVLNKCFESFRLDFGVVNKHVVTIFHADEPETFLLIEPLHSSFWHAE